MTFDAILLALRPTFQFQDFTTRQLAVLTVLAKAAEERVDFADMNLELRFSKPALGRCIKAMLKLGLVDRARGKEDNRKVFVGLTRNGWEFIKSMGVV
jgi:DNA-binding MarR family transcriptional regulator